MNYFILLGLIIWGYMTLWYFVSVLAARSDVADIAWGLGFVLVAWTSLFLGNAAFFPASSLRSVLMVFLVTVWGFRLAGHIYSRNKGKSEDYRYAEWRESWGKWFYLRSYFQIFLGQGVLLYVISLPILVVNRTFSDSMNLINYVGILTWMVGFFFEVVGDWQLSRYIRAPKPKDVILQTGLWKYSRHPNYFGEVTQWWGLLLLSIGVSGSGLAIVGPLTITFLILKVSGIPLLEKKLAEKPGFDEYAKRTSAFFPLPPKES